MENCTNWCNLFVNYHTTTASNENKQVFGLISTNEVTLTEGISGTMGDGHVLSELNS